MRRRLSAKSKSTGLQEPLHHRGKHPLDIPRLPLELATILLIFVALHLKATRCVPGRCRAYRNETRRSAESAKSPRKHEDRSWHQLNTTLPCSCMSPAGGSGSREKQGTERT